MEKELFIDRLKYALKYRNMTQNSLSQKTGINKGTLSSYLSGKYMPKQEKIYMISEALDINPQWLMCESDDIILNCDSETEFGEYCFLDRSVSAGIPDIIDSADSFEKVQLPDFLLGRYAGNSDILVMKVNGESMNRVIPDGAYIAIKTDIDINSITNGDIVVFSYNYEYSMKRFFRDRINKRYIFRPESHESCFKDIVFDQDNLDGLNIIGKVVMYHVTL